MTDLLPIITLFIGGAIAALVYETGIVAALRKTVRDNDLSLRLYKAMIENLAAANKRMAPRRNDKGRFVK